MVDAPAAVLLKMADAVADAETALEKSTASPREISRHVSRVVFFWRSVLIEKLRLGPKYRPSMDQLGEPSS